MIRYLTALLLLTTAAFAADQPPDRYFIYAATHGEHFVHPKATAVSALIISGGGSGMGSRPNMSFTQGELPVAYAMYGRKGGTACVDIKASRQITVAADGKTIPWPNHGFQADQPLFLTGGQSVTHYVHAATITQNSFATTFAPYHPPGVRDAYDPFNGWLPGQQFELNAYAQCVLGGNGGGVVGDQAVAGGMIGAFFGNLPYPRSMYWYGSGGNNILGGGAAGGDAGCKSGGGAAQVGGSNGNAGVDLQGGGGSGAGFMNPDGSYPATQWGPGSGAGASCIEVSLPLKPSYKFLAPGFALGGEPGAGGFRGGNGGTGLVMFKEKIAP